MDSKGWRLLLKWKDKSSDWLPLADLKQGILPYIQVAVYAVNNKIASEPAVAWWVSHVLLKQRNRIIKKVQTRHRNRTHKFGIKVPSSVRDALDIEERTGTNIWHKAIEKEISNVMVAFNV
jgi:hypothetical protein